MTDLQRHEDRIRELRATLVRLEGPDQNGLGMSHSVAREEEIANLHREIAFKVKHWHRIGGLVHALPSPRKRT